MRIAILSLRLLCFLLLPLVLAGAALSLYYHLPYDHRAREVVFHVRKGEPFRDVSRNLAGEGLLRFPKLFNVLAHLQGLDQRIKAGEYLFDSSWNPGEILSALCRGRVVLRRLTVPEGYTVKQISVLFGLEGLAEPQEVMRINTDPEFLSDLNLEADSLEGYLFPDTYHFAEGLSVREMLTSMVKRFREVYEPEMEARQRAMGLTVSEVVTLASIVEKETGNRQEKPLVASVLHNRLARGMPLQCDPTVIYGIENFDGNLTRHHLRAPNPYNTYVNPGLPPGPIANPGLDSLRAVLAPEKTTFLYFVSKNDGTHHFSSHLEEHNAAVKRFQPRRGP